MWYLYTESTMMMMIMTTDWLTICWENSQQWKSNNQSKQMNRWETHGFIIIIFTLFHCDTCCICDVNCIATYLSVSFCFPFSTACSMEIVQINIIPLYVLFVEKFPFGKCVNCVHRTWTVIRGYLYMWLEWLNCAPMVDGWYIKLI